MDELYRWCAVAREILQGEHAVGRVIARPFAGASGAYARTPRRRDFSLPPVGPTYLDLLRERGVQVVGVGKIGEIFVQRGVDVDDHTTDNTAGIAACLRHLEEMDEGLLFANLVDFDQTWGHRNDVEGFAAGLAEVDRAVPEFERRLRPGDAMILCADHGVDPTTASTDHSREYSPLLALGAAPGALGRRPGGRRCDRLLAPDGRGAAARRRGDPLTPPPVTADVAVVFGSGLAAIPDGALIERQFGLADFGWPAPAVAGHGSTLVLARLAERRPSRGGLATRARARAARARPRPAASLRRLGRGRAGTCRDRPGRMGRSPIPPPERLRRARRRRGRRRRRRLDRGRRPAGAAGG